MNRRRRLGILTLVVALPCAARADSDDMAIAKTATDFYAVYMTLHPSDGIPDPAVRARFAPFVSPALDRLFLDGEEAEARYARATKNQAPPLLEGDPFTPNFEGATAFRLGACAHSAGSGHCAVTLTYDSGKGKPLAWTDTVYLIRTPSGWRVDDIAYGGNREFGGNGRLTVTLRSAIGDGEAFSR